MIWNQLFDSFRKLFGEQLGLNPNASRADALAAVLADADASAALKRYILHHAVVLQPSDIPLTVRTQLNITLSDLAVPKTWNAFLDKFYEENGITSRTLPWDVVIRRTGLRDQMLYDLLFITQGKIDDPFLATMPLDARVEFGLVFDLQTAQHQFTNLRIVTKFPGAFTSVNNLFNLNADLRLMVLIEIAEGNIHPSQFQSLSFEAKSILYPNLNPDQITDAFIDEIRTIKLALSDPDNLPPISGGSGSTTIRPTTCVNNGLSWEQLLREFRLSINMCLAPGDTPIAGSGQQAFKTIEQIVRDPSLSSHFRRFLGTKTLSGEFFLGSIPSQLASDPLFINTGSGVLPHPITNLTWEDFLELHFRGVPPGQLTLEQMQKLRIAAMNQAFVDPTFYDRISTANIRLLQIPPPSPAFGTPCIPPNTTICFPIIQELRPPFQSPIAIPFSIDTEGGHVIVRDQLTPISSFQQATPEELNALLKFLRITPAQELQILTHIGRVQELAAYRASLILLPRIGLPAPQIGNNITLPRITNCSMTTGPRITTTPLRSTGRVCIDAFTGRRIGFSGLGPLTGTRIFGQALMNPIFQATLGTLAVLNEREFRILIFGALSQRFNLSSDQMQTEWANYVSQNFIYGNAFRSELDLLPAFETFLEGKYPPETRRCVTDEGVPAPETVDCSSDYDARLLNAMVNAYCSPDGKIQIFGGECQLLAILEDKLPTAAFNRTYARIKACLTVSVESLAFQFLPIAREDEHLQRFLGADFANLDAQRNEILALTRKIQQAILYYRQTPNSGEGFLRFYDLAERFQQNLKPYNDIVGPEGVNIGKEELALRFTANENTLAIATAELERLLASIGNPQLPELAPAVSFQAFIRKAMGITNPPTQRELRRAYGGCCAA